MSTLQALILGIVQGVTEFLPISSSAHLLLLPRLLGWPSHSLTFDVALHFGTLAALVAYFWQDWVRLVVAGWQSVRHRSLGGDPRRALFWFILATIPPGALVGSLGGSFIEENLRNPGLAAALLVIGGIILALADRWGKKQKDLSQIKLSDALTMGLLQVLALMPGVSRSAIVIIGGLLCGLKRDAAARFSFLIATPIVFGAAILELSPILSQGLPQDEELPFILGVLTSALVGLAAIRFLLGYLQTRSLTVFSGYRILLGATFLIFLW